jgi:hypothetical protein
MKAFLELLIFTTEDLLGNQALNMRTNGGDGTWGSVRSNVVELLSRFWEEISDIGDNGLCNFLSSGPKIGASLIIVRLIAGGLRRSYPDFLSIHVRSRQIRIQYSLVQSSTSH